MADKNKEKYSGRSNETPPSSASVKTRPLNGLRKSSEHLFIRALQGDVDTTSFFFFGGGEGAVIDSPYIKLTNCVTFFIYWGSFTLRAETM